MQAMISNFRGTFGGFAAVGCSLIMGFAFAQPKAVFGLKTQWVMVVAVMVLMLLFGAIVWVRENRGLAEDADAEAYYYLGFIYTLVTLISTFVPLLGDEKKPSTHQVLGLFGLGLITTFVGLAGRIFFLHSAPASTYSGPDQLAQACLTAATRLEAASVKFSSVAARLDQVISDSHSSVVAALEKTAVAIGAHSARAHSELTSVTAHAASRLDETVQLTGLAIRELQKRIEGLRLPTPAVGERLERQLEELSASFSSMEKELVRFAAQAQVIEVATIPQLAGAITALVETTRDIAVPLKDAASNAGALQTAVQDLLSAVAASKDLSQEITRAQSAAGQELTRGVGVVNQYHESLKKLSASLTDDLIASEDAVRKVHQNLIRATKSLTEKVQ